MDGNASAIHDELLSDLIGESKYMSHFCATRAIGAGVGHTDRIGIRCKRTLLSD